MAGLSSGRCTLKANTARRPHFCPSPEEHTPRGHIKTGRPEIKRCCALGDAKMNAVRNGDRGRKRCAVRLGEREMRVCVRMYKYIRPWFHVRIEARPVSKNGGSRSQTFASTCGEKVQIQKTLKGTLHLHPVKYFSSTKNMYFVDFYGHRSAPTQVVYSFCRRTFLQTFQVRYGSRNNAGSRVRMRRPCTSVQRKFC